MSILSIVHWSRPRANAIRCRHHSEVDWLLLLLHLFSHLKVELNLVLILVLLLLCLTSQLLILNGAARVRDFLFIIFNFKLSLLLLYYLFLSLRIRQLCLLVLGWRVNELLTQHLFDTALGILDVLYIDCLLSCFIKELLPLWEEPRLSWTLSLNTLTAALFVKLIHFTCLVTHDAVHNLIDFFQICCLLLPTNLTRVHFALGLVLKRCLRHDYLLRLTRLRMILHSVLSAFFHSILEDLTTL